MQNQEFREYRQRYNAKLKEASSFFGKFGALDDEVYASGAIDKKHKELMGLAISVVTRCDECIVYHMEGCIKAGASKQEIWEAVQIGVIGGGSITFPNARAAMRTFEELTAEIDF